MWWVAVAGVVVIGGALWGSILSNVEQPQYNVVEADHSFELRDYPPMIVAEVNVSRERKQAIGEGFRLIADYIFGNNLSSQKVAMTAPVTQQESEKIAMTAPVTQQAAGQSGMYDLSCPPTIPCNPFPSLKILPSS